MQDSDCARRETDRGGGGKLIDLFSLDNIHLNAFPRPEEQDPPAYPMTVCWSPDTKLVQLRHSVDPDLMFREYWYNSGTNESMRQHLASIVSKILGRVKLGPGDTVVDIGCNDGTMLNEYPDIVKTVGYDPARNLRPDIDVFVNDFFGPNSALTGIDAGILENVKVVTTIAMFYDIEDPVAFAKTIHEILHDDGIWVIEMHYLPDMLMENEIDAICHEHICYYSLESLSNILWQAHMEIKEVSFNSTNGGSMQVVVQKMGHGPAPDVEIQAILTRERMVPWDVRLMGFFDRCKKNATDLFHLLEGKNVYGYGASTKGNTLLQFSGITKFVLPAIAERNPEKWGRETVGTRIPIVSEETMRETHPEYLLALPYHFIDSFMKREAGFKWIVPVPTPAVLD